MGYTTDFSGRFELNKPLSDKMHGFLKLFNETRRMGRNVAEGYGVEGEFYVEGKGSFGQDNEPNVIDQNKPPRTQPSLWCQWTPHQSGLYIVWDGGEKFYDYTEWLVYLIHKVLAPNGYVLNGVVQWQGEDTGDVGEIIVEDNRVFTQAWKGEKTEHTPQNCETFSYPSNKVNYMETDVVLLVDIEQPLLTEETETSEAKDFATWLIMHTEEVTNTQGACRRYKGHVLNVNELYEVFTSL